MADGFHRLVQEIRKHVPNLKAECDPRWGSSHGGFRQAIRSSLKDSVPAGQGAKPLDDLTHPPRPQDWSVSISHSGPIGAWLAVPRPQKIGFDCEEHARVRLETLKRVSKPVELQEAPSPGALWCAKEAAFKALEDKQPRVVADVVISNWWNIAPDQYLFKPTSQQFCTGYLCSGNDLIFAAVVVSG